MPTINDPCPVCTNGYIIECEQGCIRCDNCGFHDVDEVPFEEPEAPPEPSGEMTPPRWWESLELPSGVRWYRLPDGLTQGVGQLLISEPSVPEFLSYLTGLREWAAENGLEVEPIGAQQYNIGGMYARRPHTFDVRPADVPSRGVSIGWAEDFECPVCEDTHPAYTTNCADGRPIRCSRCLFSHTDLTQEGSGPFVQFICSDCRVTCGDDDCEVSVYDTQFCEDHGHTTECFHCGCWIELHVEESFLRDNNGEVMCEDCSSRCCGQCGTFTRRNLTYNEDTGYYVCRRCLLGADDAEEFDEDASAELTIPAIPGRENIRLCGVEIEGGNGEGNGNTLAAAFCNAGLSEWDRMGAYHSGSEGGFAHVERDSSVDWEAVIGPLNPASEDDVEALTEAVKQIRSLVREGTLTLDLRAGCHIHVEAARTSLDGAYNLNLLFAYAEDVIFRLAAARWPIHRAVQDTHYTQPIPKELRKVQFARTHNESDNARYYALSFNNYFTRMLGNCRCGATRYDSWEECTCSLGKCTFEFRVFNTTANPRKLHAYLALSQALVAKAMDMGRGELSDYPALSFVARRFKDMDSTTQEELVESWKERLSWLFSELPLTDDEKASLAYCVRHSELDAVGEEFIESLLPEQQVITEVTA